LHAAVSCSAAAMNDMATSLRDRPSMIALGPDGKGAEIHKQPRSVAA
jgi:hypothetical protein